MGAFVIVYMMILCGLFRRTNLLVLSISLVFLSLLLRPSSTLAFTAAFAIGVITLHRLRLRSLVRCTCMVMVLAILAENMAVVESKSFADAIYAIEPLIKEQTLAAEDNNRFRLGVLEAARDEIQQESMLVGKAFIGAVGVPALVRLPWVQDETMLTIHSDFVIMIVQGGLIGYALFAALFIGMAWLCSRGAKLAGRAGDRGSETLFDALQAMNVIFMLWCSGNPMMQLPQCALPYLILVPLAVFLARQQPSG
jgi:hypothetical protein